jgi:O-antigen ligase
VSEVSVLPANGVISDQESVRSQLREQRVKLGFFFLLLFTFVVYARPEDIFPILAPLHLTFVFGVCAGLTYFGALLSGNASLVWSWELGIVLLLTGWFIAGLPFAYWRGGSFQVLTQVWLKTLFIFCLLTQTVLTLDRIRRLLWAIVLSEIIVTSFSIVESSRAIWIGQRMFGVNLGFLGWNFLGIAAAVSIPYIAALFVVRRSLLKTILLSAAFVSMMWMLLLTASRSGFLNVLFSIALTSLLVLRGSARGRFVGVGIALALAVGISLAPRVFWERMETVWSSSDVPTNEVAASAQESTEGRRALLNRSIQYTLERPIFGLGLGNFGVANGTELGRPDAWMGTHNTFTEISSEAGVPGLLLFIGLLVHALRNMTRISKESFRGPESLELNLMARATLASLLSFAFGACFAHLAYEYYMFYTVAVAVGIQHAAQATRATSPVPGADFVLEPKISPAKWGL